MRQVKHADLFPWILGSGLLAAGAFAAVLLMPPPAPRVLRVAATTPAMATPAPLSPPALQATSQPAWIAPKAAETHEVAAVVASNPIWQCEVNGQKIYADSPCGAGAAIRVLNETNRMRPAPIIPSTQYPRDDPPFAQPFSEDAPEIPGAVLYLARSPYGHRLPLRPLRGHHPQLHAAPHAHGV